MLDLSSFCCRLLEKDSKNVVYVERLGLPREYCSTNHLQCTDLGSAKADYVIIPHSVNYFSGEKNYWLSHGTLLHTVIRNNAPVGYLFSTHKTP